VNPVGVPREPAARALEIGHVGRVGVDS
jgi:hypothetical protein